MTDSDPDEPVTVTDKRRIDPETGEVRDSVPEPAPWGHRPPEGQGDGPVPEPDTADTADAADVDAAEVAELRATLQRVKAEYDNYRKRTMRDQQMLVDRAKAGVLAELLPILDDLERARSHGDLESGPFKAVADKLSSALTSAGLSPFGEAGEEFDPALHEAVQHEGDGSNPVIGHVMRRGYLVGDQVVRHAMVGVVDTVPDDPGGETDTPDNAGVSEQQTAESDTATE